MADPCFPALAPPGGAGSFRFWEKDPARVAQEIVEGRPFQVFDTERGRFDAMLDFMLRSGLWAAATGMRPSHKIGRASCREGGGRARGAEASQETRRTTR